MKTKICPKCKKGKVIIKMTPLTSHSFPAKFKCNKCGFESYVYLKKEKKSGKKVKCKPIN